PAPAASPPRIRLGCLPPPPRTFPSSSAGSQCVLDSTSDGAAEGRSLLENAALLYEKAVTRPRDAANVSRPIPSSSAPEIGAIAAPASTDAASEGSPLDWRFAALAVY